MTRPEHHEPGIGGHAMPFAIKPVLWGLFALLVVFFSLPLLFENRGNECSALEAKAIATSASDTSQQAIGNMFQGLSNGAIASAEMNHEYPLLPTPVSCAYQWWRIAV